MDITKELLDLKQNGYVVIKSYYSDERCAELVDEIDEIKSEQKGYAAPVGRQNSIKDDDVINNVHFWSENFLDLCSCGVHLDILKDILNDPYYGLIDPAHPNFILAQFNARRSDSAIAFHFDTRLKLGSEQTWSMQCILALEDRDNTNGGLMVIPGSHKDDFISSEDLDISSCVNVDLSAGDLVLFYSGLYHATHAPSHSGKSAWGLLLTYRSWWCKPQFDFVNMFGADRISQLNHVQKTLLGCYSQPAADPLQSPSARTGY